MEPVASWTHKTQRYKGERSPSRPPRTARPPRLPGGPVTAAEAQRRAQHSPSPSRDTARRAPPPPPPTSPHQAGERRPEPPARTCFRLSAPGGRRPAAMTRSSASPATAVGGAQRRPFAGPPAARPSARRRRPLPRQPCWREVCHGRAGSAPARLRRKRGCCRGAKPSACPEEPPRLPAAGPSPPVGGWWAAGRQR